MINEMRGHDKMKIIKYIAFLMIILLVQSAFSEGDELFGDVTKKSAIDHPKHDTTYYLTVISKKSHEKTKYLFKKSCTIRLRQMMN